MTSTDTRLVGRDEELSRLRELVAPPYDRSRVLLILGDPGTGKTVLLAEAVRAARSAGMRVLAAAGRESEQDLAFAGLHQLLRPVLDRLAGLPARQADALRGALAISADPVPPDALLTGIALLTLLSGLSDDGPVLVAADDAQWLDRASLDALAFRRPCRLEIRVGSSCCWSRRAAGARLRAVSSATSRERQLVPLLGGPPDSRWLLDRTTPRRRRKRFTAASRCSVRQPVTRWR